MKELVVLVHGFLVQGYHMMYMARELRKLGYATLVPYLPTGWKNVAACSGKLDIFLKKHRLQDFMPIHFVGHSMGGLIIRHYLSVQHVANIGRVVLMGTPNRGSPQSRYVSEHFPPMRRFCEAPLRDLAEPGLEIAPPLNDPAPQIGVIIGMGPRIILSGLLEDIQGPHDGLVPLQSARLPGAEEVLLPHNHTLLNWNPRSVRLVDRFLRTGKFE